MKPVSFSATAMQVAELCLTRYKAEHIDRGRGMGNSAATLGTSVHGALEMFVKVCLIENKQEPELQLLLEMFRMSYMTTFGTADTDTVEYTDGVDMLTRWFERNITSEYFKEVTILTCEVKKNFPIKTTIGEIPYNYIFDRSEQIGESAYKVVDYKTNRWAVRPDELKKKIQVRAYGLAMQIQYPQAEEIWVELDMLRHDGPVGVRLTRDDNIAAWKFFKEKAQQIVDAPDNPMPTLNPECRFCTIKSSCSALKKNISVGGVMSYGGAAKMVDVRAQLEYQKAAIQSAIDEMDTLIIAEAKETDILEWESERNKLEITASSRRSADAERIEMVIGPQLFAKYGSASISVTTVDKLLKGNELTDAQKRQLRGLIYSKRGEAKVKASPRAAIGGDS